MFELFSNSDGSISWSAVANLRSTHLYVGEFASNAGRHVRATYLHPWRKTLALIPPLPAMCLAEKTQMFPIRKNTHGDPQTLQNKQWRTSAK